MQHAGFLVFCECGNPACMIQQALKNSTQECALKKPTCAHHFNLAPVLNRWRVVLRARRSLCGSTPCSRRDTPASSLTSGFLWRWLSTPQLSREIVHTAPSANTAGVELTPVNRLTCMVREARESQPDGERIAELRRPGADHHPSLPDPSAIFTRAAAAAGGRAARGPLSC